MSKFKIVQNTHKILGMFESFRIPWLFQMLSMDTET